MRGLDLHTVCEEAHCPNLGECWSRGTATFMILGDVCTRACGFCAVKTGLPGAPPDLDEPRRVADAVARMGLRHAVVTSVNRDDQPDGGAGIFAATIPRDPRADARVHGRGADPRLQGALGGAAGRARRAPRDPQPQRRDRAPPVPPGALGGALRPLARAAEALEGAGAADQERDHGRPRRGAGRARGDDPGDPGLRHRRAHDRPVPAALAAAPAGGALLRARRVRGAARVALGLGYAHVESGPLVRSSYHAEEQVPR